MGYPHRVTAESISRQPFLVINDADIRQKGLVKTMSQNVCPYQGAQREHAGARGFGRASR